MKNLQLYEEVLPPPHEDEVQVAIRAIGLNFADIFSIWGLYKAAPKEPFTPGLEYAGVVTATGPKVTRIRIGDRVMGITRFGAFATGLNISEKYVVPVPDGWDCTTAAAYLVQTITAYYGLFTLGALQPGQNILLHSVAGGVGLQALKIAKAHNCFVVGTVGHPNKIAIAEANGCDRVLVRGPNFEKALRKALEGRPLNLVFDTIGGRYFTIPWNMLAPMGRMIVAGSSRYASVGDRPNLFRLLWHYLTRPKIDPQALPEQNRSLMGFNLIYLYERIEMLPPILEHLEQMHLTPPHVGHTFSFEHLKEAIRLFQSGQTVGKVVVQTTAPC
ncbi:MAG: zinc-binding dehydrogenase [Saprospiraceae bacterium]|nr:zinc-binding dehydrogenase [Saprospiraceae bacterium]MDW8483035.1 zinc-binding dehydrogenase [Saprospiraceae bacterium]